MVERRGKWNYATCADPAVGWFKADYSAQCSRRGTSGRAPCNVSGIPGIVHLPEITDYGTCAVGELMHILFPQQYRTRTLKAADDISILGGDAIFEYSAGGGGANAGSVNQILKPDRDSVQRTTPSPLQNFRFGLARLSQREIGGNPDERVEFRIQFFDSGQAVAGEFQRRDVFNRKLCNCTLRLGSP